MTRRTITGILVGLGGLAVVAYAMRPATVEVDTALATRGPMRVTVDEEGMTRVRERYVIASPVSGLLERVSLREGEEVRTGQIVARVAPLPLDVPAYRQAAARLTAAEAIQQEAMTRIQDARAAEEQASETLRRRQALLPAGAISQEAYDQLMRAHDARQKELDAARSRGRAAEADVDAARAALLALDGGARAGVAVRSPAHGRVLRIPEKSERVVAPGTPILELGDASALEVVVDVLSSDAVRVRPGDRVEIAEWGGDSVLTGRVRSVEPSAFTRVSALGVDEQRVNVRIDLVAPPPTLGDGFRVEARMVVWEGSDVLSVPASALFQRRGGAWSVFVMEGGRARLRTVGIGHRTSVLVEILTGLGPGAEVILFPSDQLRDGVRVRRTHGRP